MARIIAFIVGLGFIAALVLAMITTPLKTEHDPVADFHKHPKHLALASDGPFGKFDRQQLQRGFQVYKEVCAACHSLNYVAFRDLHALGYNEAEVKAIAKGWAAQVPSINPDTGEAATRAALPTDKILGPYPNDVAARAANNNAMPPDLSLITKARHGGGAYIYSLLTGYEPVPANLPKELKPGTGLHYNPYFPTLNLAMPQPIASDGQVTYADGTNASIDQMSKDVSAFLVWTAEPKLEQRHQTGWVVLAFLLIATALAYMSYRTIWANKKH